jgi:hypothetical protein
MSFAAFRESAQIGVWERSNSMQELSGFYKCRNADFPGVCRELRNVEFP